MRRRVRRSLGGLLPALLLVGLAAWYGVMMVPGSPNDLGRLSTQVQATTLGFATVLGLAALSYAGLKEQLRRRNRRAERIAHEPAHKV